MNRIIKIVICIIILITIQTLSLASNQMPINIQADEEPVQRGSGIYTEKWEELVDLNRMLTTDIQELAIYAEEYLKANMDTIGTNNIDKYLNGINTILSNSQLKLSTDYKDIYNSRSQVKKT